MLRRKSGNYTVRRPLEIGAAMAGCTPEVLDALGGYGAAIGEAFQLRDDLLGVFGSQTLTGKSVGTDLAAQKATSVVVAAHQLADAALRRQLSELMSTPALGPAELERWRALIIASGAVQWIEQLIDERLARALGCLDTAEIPEMPALHWKTWPSSAPRGPPDAHRRGKNRPSRRRRCRAGRVCPRRCTWPAAAAPSPSSNAATVPAAGSGGPTSPAIASTPVRRC